MPTASSELLGNAVLGLFVFFTLGGAVLAVSLKNIFHNVLCFAVSLLGVAGIFVFLHSEFLALMQIMIYVGAVVVAMAFAVMLSPPQYLAPDPRSKPKILFSLATSLLFFAFLSKAIRMSHWQIDDAATVPSVVDLGMSLMDKFSLAFVMVSLALFVAVVGAILAAGRGTSGGQRR